MLGSKYQQLVSPALENILEGVREVEASEAGGLMRRYVPRGKLGPWVRVERRHHRLLGEYPVEGLCLTSPLEDKLDEALIQLRKWAVLYVSCAMAVLREQVDFSRATLGYGAENEELFLEIRR